MHTRAQMKDVGQRIGNLPSLGQRRLQIEMFVAADKAIKKQLVDALGESVNANSWIEIQGTGFDDHRDRLRLGAGRRTGERCKSNG